MDNIMETRLNQTVGCDGVIIKEDDIIEVVSNPLGMKGLQGKVSYIKLCKNIETGNESILIHFYDKTGMRLGLHNTDVMKIV